MPASSAELPSRGLRRAADRLHLAVLLCYAIDAVLLTGYGAIGIVPLSLGWMFGASGIALTALQVLMLNRSRGHEADITRANIAMTLGGGGLLLATAALAPEVGGLMLMTLMSVTAMVALQVTGRHLLLLYVVLVAGSVAAISAAERPLQLPTAGWAERAVTGVWFAWLLAKCAAINVVGTRLRQLVGRSHAKLARALVELERVAATDDMTALPNRRAIVSSLHAALQAATSPGAVVGVALLDIDHFKAVNDRFGHATGDRVLTTFAGVISASLRPTDAVGRYGGEEFLVVLHDVRDAAAAREAAERLRRAVETHDWGGIARGLALTASLGVALRRDGEDSSSVIRRADAALYAAKDAGRNRVVA